MTDIHIPPEAVEAAARAAYYAFTEINIGDGEDRWERLLPRFRAEYREQARAAIRAALGAWPGMYPVSYGGDEPPFLVLPLTETSTKENDNG
jgi:hypothetical protein